MKITTYKPKKKKRKVKHGFLMRSRTNKGKKILSRRRRKQRRRLVP